MKEKIDDQKPFKEIHRLLKVSRYDRIQAQDGTVYETNADRNHEEELDKAWDDVTGAAVDPKKVAEERQNEIWHIRTHGVYRKVKRSSVPKGAKIIHEKHILDLFLMPTHFSVHINSKYKSKVGGY